MPARTGRRTDTRYQHLTNRWLLILGTAACLSANADIQVNDDTGNQVTLAEPAQRIISLAPHITELLFAAGAGDAVIGAVSYSDYPPAARQIPRVGDYESPNLETIMGLRPDLIVAWQAGNSTARVEQLRALGLTVFVSQPRYLDDIATSIERLGRLAGTTPVAYPQARKFRQELTRLQRRYAQRPAVTLFYETWNQPLMTVNGEHVISDVIRLCGGRNVFADLPGLSLTIGVESVLNADPQAIVASGMGEERPQWLDAWHDWPQLRAVRDGYLFFIPPDLLQRHSPRILQGAQRLCDFLERVRVGN